MVFACLTGLLWRLWVGTVIIKLYSILKFTVLGGDASPPELSMWLQTVKFIVEKSKCAGLAQEIGFLHQICAPCSGW